VPPDPGGAPAVSRSLTSPVSFSSQRRPQQKNRLQWRFLVCT
jgi:hypothetical protein